MIQKIALSGKACSGKGTIVQMIYDYDLEHLSGEKFDCINFADPIKNIALKLYPNLNRDLLWGDSKLRGTIIEGQFDSDGNPLTIRKLLTDIGKFGRVYNVNVFINSILTTAEQIITNPKKVVFICDCRFKNELQALKEHGYYIIRVIRPDNPVSIDDISETDLDDVPLTDFNEVLINDDLQKLPEKIQTLMKKLLASSA